MRQVNRCHQQDGSLGKNVGSFHRLFTRLRKQHEEADIGVHLQRTAALHPQCRWPNACRARHQGLLWADSGHGARFTRTAALGRDQRSTNPQGSVMTMPCARRSLSRVGERHEYERTRCTLDSTPIGGKDGESQRLGHHISPHFQRIAKL